MTGGWPTAYAVLGMVVDLARCVTELNDGLRANSKLIALMKEERPDLWENLRRRTQERRAAWAAAPSAPPAPYRPPRQGRLI